MATKTMAKGAVFITGHCTSEHHHQCKVAMTSPGGTVVRCGCDCHTGDEPVHDLRNPCKVCGETLQIAHDCDSVIAKRDLNPTYRRLQEAKAMVAANSNGHAKVQRIKAEPRPKVGRCEFSGEATKGGRFLSGNDARLKSVLKKRAETGDVEALAELLARNWPYPETTKTLFNKADKMATVEWLAGRVTERFTAWDNGGDPWQ